MLEMGWIPRFFGRDKLLGSHLFPSAKPSAARQVGATRRRSGLNPSDLAAFHYLPVKPFHQFFIPTRACGDEEIMERIPLLTSSSPN